MKKDSTLPKIFMTLVALIVCAGQVFAENSRIRETGGLPIGIAVDLNRDGIIQFDAGQPRIDKNGDIVFTNDATDKTHPKLPFRFWINNDLDVVNDQTDRNYENPINLEVTNCDFRDTTYNESPDPGEPHYVQVCEQWDEDPILHEMTNTSSNNIERIEADGDLEDFSPLVIKIDLEEMISNGYTIELRANGVGINLFKGAWKNGVKRAHAYIYDTQETKSQMALANSNGGHVFALNKNAKYTLDNQFIEKYIGADGLGYFIFEGLSESDSICEENPEKCYISLALYKEDIEKPLHEDRLYLDLHETRDFYEHITAGTAQPDDREPPDFNPPENYTASITRVHNREIDIYAGLYAPEQIQENMILYVHGWRVLDIEKLSFGETAFKRLYWSGYYGQFTRLSWPTGWFYKPAGAYSDVLAFVLGNERNYNLSETVARKVGEALSGWIKNQYTHKVHAIAHSMGNVVVSEALRTADSKILESYSPSQAAESAGAYDSKVPDKPHQLLIGISILGIDLLGEGCAENEAREPESAWRCYNKDNDLSIETKFDMPPDLWRNDFILRDDTGTMLPILDANGGNIIHHVATSSTVSAGNDPIPDLLPMGANELGKHYYRGIKDKVGTIVNFYNLGDSALSAWEFNQLTKPDFLDGPTWHYSNSYLQQYKEYLLYQDCLDTYQDKINPVDYCVAKYPDDWPALEPQLYEADGTTPKKYYSEFKRGDITVPFYMLDAQGQRIPYNANTAIEILSHVIPARTAAAGQVAITDGEFKPTDTNAPSHFTDSNHDHSAAYYGSYSEHSPNPDVTELVRAQYWINILRSALKLTVTDENEKLSKLANE